MDGVTPDEVERVALLGTGHMATVWMSRIRGGMYAVKTIPKSAIVDDGQLKRVLTEKAVLKEVSHPFLPVLHTTFQDPDSLNFVMDVVGGGELTDHIRCAPDGRLDEPRVKVYTAELVLALGYLHGKNVVFRDVKAGNVVIKADGHLCLVDFGYATKLDTPDSRCCTYLGTPPYMAPEMVVSGASRRYGKPVDWWGLGVLVYQMLCGRYPFEPEGETDAESGGGGGGGVTGVGAGAGAGDDDDRPHPDRVVSSNPFTASILRGVSAVSFDDPVFGDGDDPTSAAHFIRCLLEADPAGRLATAEGAKAHRWLAGVPWVGLEAGEVAAPEWDKTLANKLDGDEDDGALTAEEQALFADF